MPLIGEAKHAQSTVRVTHKLKRKQSAASFTHLLLQPRQGLDMAIQHSCSARWERCVFKSGGIAVIITGDRHDGMSTPPFRVS